MQKKKKINSYAPGKTDDVILFGGYITETRLLTKNLLKENWSGGLPYAMIKMLIPDSDTNEIRFTSGTTETLLLFFNEHYKLQKLNLGSEYYHRYSGIRYLTAPELKIINGENNKNVNYYELTFVSHYNNVDSKSAYEGYITYTMDGVVQDSIQTEPIDKDCICCGQVILSKSLNKMKNSGDPSKRKTWDFNEPRSNLTFCGFNIESEMKYPNNKGYKPFKILEADSSYEGLESNFVERYGIVYENDNVEEFNDDYVPY